MSLQFTIVVMVLGALLMVSSQVLERRARAQGDRSRFPTTVMLFLGGVLLLVPVGHLLSLLTGTSFDQHYRP